MPKAILDELPEEAQKVFEDAWDYAKKEDWDDSRASAYAIGAVKKAGYRKDEASGNWTQMLEPMFVVFGEPINDGQWIEVACTGNVVDMGGRRLSITPADFGRWIQAYEGGERGQELPITVDHPKQGGVAAGWFRGLRRGPKREIRGSLRDTLLMRPEWTPLGREKVDNQEYKYFSLEIAPGNMLRGGSLVNFPAIKGLKPVTDEVRLGEFFLMELYMAESSKCLECDAVVPDGSAACPACGTKIESKEPEEKELVMSEEHKDETPQVEVFEARLAEIQADLERKLGEAQSQISASEEKNRELAEQVGRLSEINDLLRLSDKVNDFMQLGEHKNRQIAPAFADQIVQILLAAPAVEDEILALLGAIATGEAVLELGELGSGAVPELREDGASVGRKRMHDKAKKLSEDSEISYREALIEMGKED